MDDLTQLYNQTYQTLPFLINIITIFINLFFAGAVAKDSGRLSVLGQPTILVNGITWSFATLCGGVYVAAVYWLLHHSSLTRTTLPTNSQN